MKVLHSKRGLLLVSSLLRERFCLLPLVVVGYNLPLAVVVVNRLSFFIKTKKIKERKGFDDT
jgi:hypothetical protein